MSGNGDVIEPDEGIAAIGSGGPFAMSAATALLLVADTKNTYLVSGNGDVIEPDEGIAAIGSGGPFAMSAATALIRNTKLSAKRIAEEAMAIAGRICIYTNDQVTYEELE